MSEVPEYLKGMLLFSLMVLESGENVMLRINRTLRIVKECPTEVCMKHVDKFVGFFFSFNEQQK